MTKTEGGNKGERPDVVNKNAKKRTDRESGEASSHEGVCTHSAILQKEGKKNDRHLPPLTHDSLIGIGEKRSSRSANVRIHEKRGKARFGARKGGVQRAFRKTEPRSTFVSLGKARGGEGRVGY